ncbi:hypothetical protein LPJ61_000319 [Coemansia biformis]|uniref:RNase H type-1 domain-containing protein n=1 Tax=Coemansia biformis TaxID=1286918 RepID=A0A9W8D1R6_9FUNG|nr:hypothetical protein LPJ61_000319 [Coemansia biformis]
MEVPPPSLSGFFGVQSSNWRGVCGSWGECMAKMKGAVSAKYRWFDSLADAQSFADAGAEGNSGPVGNEPGASMAAPGLEPEPSPVPSAPEAALDTPPCVVSHANTYTLLLRDGSRHYIPDMPLAPAAGASLGEFVIYTDGSSLWNGKEHARAGVGVFFGPGDRRNVSEPLPGLRQSSVRAELAAIVLALAMANSDASLGQFDRIRICTDSLHGISCLTKWHDVWESNGWRHASGSVVEDRDLIEAGIRCIRSSGRIIEFTHVRAHIGIEGNVQADRLAVDGARREGDAGPCDGKASGISTASLPAASISIYNCIPWAMDSTGTAPSTSRVSSAIARIRGSFWRELDGPRDAVRLFLPSWFTVSMGSGVLASCIWRIPYESGALRVLGSVVFFLNIGLLALFLVLQAAQLALYPETVQWMRQHRQQMLHYGAVPMALATVVAGAASYPFSEMGPVVLYTVWSLWWLSVVLAVAASVLLICLIVSRDISSLESVTGAWLLLVAPLSVCAGAGGNLAEYLPPSLGLATLVTGYCLLGAGAPLTCCIVVLYVHRITVHKLPAHDAIITAFIPIGPIAQMGAAALSLGTVAQEALGQQHLGSLGSTMLHLGIITGLLSWGSAAFWAVHAVFSVVYQRWSAAIPFNMGWWSLVFPLGVFASLTAALGAALEMWFFILAFCGFVGVLVVLWLLVMARTIVGAWTGEILAAQGLPALDGIKGQQTDSASDVGDDCRTDCDFAHHV